MRTGWLALVFIACFLFPVTARAQGPTPPPSLAEICLPEGKFDFVECVRAVWDVKGGWGVLAFSLIAFFVLYFLSPGGKGLQDRVKEKSGEWWLRVFPWLRPAVSLTPLQRREAEDNYLYRFEKSEILRQRDEVNSRFDDYLQSLNTGAVPLRPLEEGEFVDLESGLSVRPNIGFSTKVQNEQSKSIVEIKTFYSLEEAAAYLDERTGHPYPALTLLGEPGAGKSTLLRKFARKIVRERIADALKPLPIFVSLSAHKNGTPLAFLRQHWNRMLGFEGLDDALAEGKVWLILDGLNEMPRANYHIRMSEWSNFLRGHCAVGKGNRALIACRVADYGDGVDTPMLTIHAMDDERIQQFLKKRNPELAEALWESLKKDRDEGRGAIYELAKTPFWLDMLARRSGKDGLPRNRADLIAGGIREWLEREGSRAGARELEKIHQDAFMEGLTQLGWVGLAHGQNYTFSKTAARRLLESHQKLLSADDILGLARDCSLTSEEETTARFHHQLFQEYFAAIELARRFVGGKNLSKLWKPPWRNWKFVQSEWTPLPSPPQTFWEEAVILAAGMLDSNQAQKLTLRVLDHNSPLAARCVLEAGIEMSEVVKQKVKLRLQNDVENPRVRLPARLSAGKMLAKLGDPRLLKRRGEVELADGRKVNFIAPEWIEIPAGSFQMGTTPAQAWLLRRQKANPISDELYPHSVFVSGFKMARYPVTVAEYRCFMDADGYENDEYWREENSLRWRNAILPFEESYQYQYIKMLREQKDELLKAVDIWVKQGSWSPAQAKNFINTMNSDDDKLREQWEDNEKEKRDDNGKVTKPWLWDNQQYAIPNQPVIGITWYEACAYAAWLTEISRSKKMIAEQDVIHLPAEAEWEKAARGTSGRLWAWGNLWSSAHANTLEGRVMQPTTVGAYPQNKSPYGIEDMIGNVWEWCMDWYNENEYKRSTPQSGRVDKEHLGKEVKDPCRLEGGHARVLRGGSWINDRDYARCSARRRGAPVDFGYSLGFRLVCAPPFKTL